MYVVYELKNKNNQICKENLLRSGLGKSYRYIYIYVCIHIIVGKLIIVTYKKRYVRIGRKGRRLEGGWGNFLSLKSLAFWFSLLSFFSVNL